MLRPRPQRGTGPDNRMREVARDLARRRRVRLAAAAALAGKTKLLQNPAAAIAPIARRPSSHTLAPCARAGHAPALRQAQRASGPHPAPPFLACPLPEQSIISLFGSERV